MSSVTSSHPLDSSLARTTKRLDDPALSNRAFAIFFIIAILIAISLLLAPRAGAATVSWNAATGKWESNSWTGGVGSAPPTATDDAVIGNNGTVNYDSVSGTRTVLTLSLGKGNPGGGNGTLNISGGSLSITNNLTISAGSSMTGTLTLTGGTLTVGGNIVDGGNGTGTLTLNGGTLDMTNGSISADVLNFQSGTLSNVTQLFAFNGTTVVALTKTTSGTLTLSGTNTYTGGTNINGGILALGSAGALGTTGTISFGGGTLQYSAANTTDYSSRFSNAASQQYSIDTNGQNVTFATGLTSSGGTFTKLGTGTLTFTGTNTYTGATTISGGTLQIGNGGTTGTLGSGNVVDNGTLTFNRSNALSVSNNISGSGIVNQNGIGTTTLSGTNSYSGPTNVNAGTLLVNGTNSGTGTVTVNNSGTLGGSGTIAGAVTLNSSSKIDAGAAVNTTATLHTGALTLNNTSIFHADIAGVSSFDQVMVTGAVTLASTSVLQVQELAGFHCTLGQMFTIISNDLSDAIVGKFSNAPTNGSLLTVGTDNYRVFYNGGDGNDLVLTCVPEPSTWLGAALALGVIGYSQRRRFVARLVRQTVSV